MGLLRPAYINYDIVTRELVCVCLCMQSWTTTIKTGQANIDSIGHILTIKALRACLALYCLVEARLCESQLAQVWTGHDDDAM